MTRELASRRNVCTRKMDFFYVMFFDCVWFHNTSNNNQTEENQQIKTSALEHIRSNLVEAGTFDVSECTKKTLVNLKFTEIHSVAGGDEYRMNQFLRI